MDLLNHLIHGFKKKLNATTLNEDFIKLNAYNIEVNLSDACKMLQPKTLMINFSTLLEQEEFISSVTSVIKK